MNEFPSEKEFAERLEMVKILALTRAEALFLSDNMTLLLEHDKEQTTYQIPARSIKASATVPVSLEMVLRVGLAVLLTTDPHNKSQMAEMPIAVSELYLLRECCQSFITYGNELVGYNLIRKIYKLLLEEDMKEREFINRITSDLIGLDDIPRVEKTGEKDNADKHTSTDS